MAFSKQERRDLIVELVTNDSDLEGQEDWLGKLTDNQLIALRQPEDLDDAIDIALAAVEAEDEDDGQSGPDTNEDESSDDGTPDTNEGGDKDDLEDRIVNKLFQRLSANNKTEGYGTPKAEMKGKKKKKPEMETNQLSEDEWLQQAPEGVQRLVANAKRAEQQERAELIEIITANDANDFTEDQLKETSMDVLESLAKLAARGTAPSRPTVNYAGRGGGQGTLVGNSRHTEEPLSLPDLGWDK